MLVSMVYGVLLACFFFQKLSLDPHPEVGGRSSDAMQALGSIGYAPSDNVDALNDITVGRVLIASIFCLRIARFCTHRNQSKRNQ